MKARAERKGVKDGKARRIKEETKSAFLRDGLNQWLASVPLRNKSELKISASQRTSHGS